VITEILSFITGNRLTRRSAFHTRSVFHARSAFHKSRKGFISLKKAPAFASAFFWSVITEISRFGARYLSSLLRKRHAKTALVRFSLRGLSPLGAAKRP